MYLSPYVPIPVICTSKSPTCSKIMYIIQAYRRDFEKNEMCSTMAQRRSPVVRWCRGWSGIVPGLALHQRFRHDSNVLGLPVATFHGQNMFITSPRRGFRDVWRVVVLLFILVRRLEAAARERVRIRVRWSTGGTEEDAAQTHLVAGSADKRLNDGEVRYNDGHKGFTAGPSTARDSTVRSSLEYRLA